MISAEIVTVTKSGLDALREDRNELSRDYRKLANEADELRHQRDEALQALRNVMQHKDSRLSTDVEYIGICQKAQRILAQYEDGDA